MARSHPVPAARETGVVIGRAAALLFLHVRVQNLVLPHVLAVARGELHGIIPLRSSLLRPTLGILGTRTASGLVLSPAATAELATSIVVVLECDRSPEVEVDATSRSQVEPRARVPRRPLQAFESFD